MTNASTRAATAPSAPTNVAQEFGRTYPITASHRISLFNHAATTTSIATTATHRPRRSLLQSLQLSHLLPSILRKPALPTVQLANWLRSRRTKGKPSGVPNCVRRRSCGQPARWLLRPTGTVDVQLSPLQRRRLLQQLGYHLPFGLRKLLRHICAARNLNAGERSLRVRSHRGAMPCRRGESWRADDDQQRDPSREPEPAGPGSVLLIRFPKHARPAIHLRSINDCTQLQLVFHMRMLGAAKPTARRSAVTA